MPLPDASAALPPAGGGMGLGSLFLSKEAKQKKGERDREEALRLEEGKWYQAYVVPFQKWLGPQIPGTDPMGPGGVRHAADSLWALTRFRTELRAWMEDGAPPLKVQALRNAIMLERGNFEILHRFLGDRHMHAIPPWTLTAYATPAAYWEAFQAAMQEFESGVKDPRAWVPGLARMLMLCVSWVERPPPGTLAPAAAAQPLPSGAPPA